MNSNCFKHAIYYGFGLMGILYITMFMASTVETSNVAFMLLKLVMLIAIPIVGCILCVRCRRGINNDNFTYGQAFSYLMLLFSSGVVVSTIFVLVFVKWINKDFLIEYAEKIRTVSENLSGILGEASRESLEKSLDTVANPLFFSLNNGFSLLITALFLALIGAAFTKKRTFNGLA